MTEATVTEAAPVPDLATLSGKRISLTFHDKDSGESQTLEGRVEIGSEVGLMFKEKGKSNVLLIEASQIDAVGELAPKEPNVSVKTLQPIPLGRIRQHLADRHGYKRSDVNGLSEAQAEELHDSLDHSELAHKHEVPKAQTEAGSESDGEADAA
jgi:hypothetical protein